MFGVLRNRRGKTPVFRRGMKAPAFAFIIQWFLVYSYYVDIQVKLYSSKRNRKIDAMLREACFVWNHALALQKRYYRLTGRYCSCSRMKHHFFTAESPDAVCTARPFRRYWSGWMPLTSVSFCTCRPDRRSSSAPSSSEASCTNRAGSSWTPTCLS